MRVPAFLVFFLSGVAALLYQVVWQRMLAFFSGTDVYSFTIIVAAFMAGLGIGHLSGGQIADRVTSRTNILLFAASELAIALFSFFSRGLYYDLLYQRLGSLAIAPAFMAVILFASLLWPTFFMGMSLPLIGESADDHARSRGLDHWCALRYQHPWRSGRSAGCHVVDSSAVRPGWQPADRGDAQPDLRRGGAADRLAHAKGVGSLFSSRKGVRSLFRTRYQLENDSRPLFLFWIAIYGLSGFLALSLEIVWFRLLGVMVKSTAFTFGTLLSIYLSGLALGALAGSRYAARLRRPDLAFLALQTAVGLSAACLFAAFIGVSDDVRWIRGYFGSYDPLNVRDSVDQLRALLESLVSGTEAPTAVPWQLVGLYFVLPALLILIPTFLMGFSFPVLQRVVQTDLDRLGRRVGLLLVANVGGSVLGTVFTGWVLLSVLGTAGTLKVLTAISGTFTLFAFGLLRPAGATVSRHGVSVRASMGVADGCRVRLDSLPDARCRPTLGAPARHHD